MLACHGPLLVGAMGPISSGLRINTFLVRANTKAIAVIGECAQEVMKVLGAWPVVTSAQSAATGFEVGLRRDQIALGL